MPSFDIVSRIELPEVDNALAGITREIGTRFDFKGSKCKVERQEGVLNVVAELCIPANAFSVLLVTASRFVPRN